MRRGRCQKKELLHQHSDIKSEDFCHHSFAADVILYERKRRVLEGIVRYGNRNVASNVLLKLYRIDRNQMVEIACTRSDSKGYYRFEIYEERPSIEYKIAVVSPDDKDIYGFKIIKKKEPERPQCCYFGTQHCAICEYYDTIHKRCLLR